MKISTKGRYALRFMIDLAKNGRNTNVSIKHVCERLSISMKYLEQIATALSKAGLITSTRGAQGGYRLSKEPKDYTVAEILAPIEGPIACVACLESTPNHCPKYDTCSTIHFWHGLNQLIINYLSSSTLEDLLNENSSSDCYII